MSKNTGIDGEKNKVVKHDMVRPVGKDGKPVPYAMALVMNCVKHYRGFMMPLKTIYLKPELYMRLKDWVRKQATEQQADLNIRLEGLTYDGVSIRCMETISREEITWDFYPQDKTIN